MKTSFTYISMGEYLPKRYSANQSQERMRREVYDFKDGRAASYVYDKFVGRVNDIIGSGSSSSYCVCFIPASEQWKTDRRFSTLASIIRNNTGCSCSVRTITCPDHESGHIHGKSSNPAECYTVNSSDVRNKRVILIDDVITRGRTFEQTAGKLIDAGAIEVTGLFLAKTINPDWSC